MKISIPKFVIITVLTLFWVMRVGNVSADENSILLEPINNSTVSGEVSIIVREGEATEVEFFAQNLSTETVQYLSKGSLKNQDIWQTTWYTNQIENGGYRLYIKAYDEYGIVIPHSDSILVDVENEEKIINEEPAKFAVDVDQNQIFTSETFVPVIAEEGDIVYLFAESQPDGELAYLGEAQSTQDGFGVNVLPNFDDLRVLDVFAVSENDSRASVTDRIRIETKSDVESISRGNYPKSEGFLSEEIVDYSIIDLSKSNKFRDWGLGDDLVFGNLTIDDITLHKYDVPQVETVYNKLFLKGRAIPNASITLYIHSNPVVVTTTVDENGNWKYEFDSGIEDGEHEIYYTISDSRGNVVGRSEIFSFTVSEAVAAEIGDVTDEVTTQNPIFDAYWLWFSALVVISVMIFLSIRKFVLKH